jgi:acetyl esterase/lipase
MLDDRTQMDDENPQFPYLSWSPSSNTIAWNAYLGKLNDTGNGGKPHLCPSPPPVHTNMMSREATVPDTSSPGRAEDLHGLPPTHIGVGSLDLFRDEATSFGARLSSQDVKVQSNVYPGVPHGFDGVPSFRVRTELWDNEANFVKQF